MKIPVSPKTFWQTIFAFTFIINLVILIWSISRWVELKVVLWRSVWIVPLGLYVTILIGCVLLFLWIQKGGADRLILALERERLSGTLWRALSAGLFTTILLAIPWLKFSFHVGEVVKKSTQDPVLTTIVFYWAVWWLVLMAAAALKTAFRASWPAGFAAALVVLGIAYEIFNRAHDISTYPFSLGWSESSRFYYGSLYFAQFIYGMQVPLSPLHPTRYFLQSLPFLVPGSSLVFSRVWQVLLWVVLTAVGAVALAWRALPGSDNEKPASPGPLAFLRIQPDLRWLFAGWLFLFLLRVGVYYHLEVMVIVPVLFVSAKRPWRSLAAVAFASAWAGVSRVNWFPVPAMLAAAIYLLEEPVPTDAAGLPARAGTQLRQITGYLKQPALWLGVGLFSALAAQAMYIPLSGNANNARAFTSSFFSQLLPERLWPNDTFPLGVVLAILIVSGPLLLVLLRSGLARLHPVRWVGLSLMLVVLFAGGLIVSIKIGGGGDLHNMDAYAIFVSLLALYFIGGKVAGEATGQTLPWPVAAIALIVLLVFLVPSLSPFPVLNEKANQTAFLQLKTLSEQAGQNGPVLFISERHLVTFHQIDLPLVPEYEAVTLMEMAMSNNQAYLQQFYDDLKNHRFAAIVAGKQNVGTKEEGSFADESNVWNARVSPYILCYYEPVTEIDTGDSRIEFYVPRDEAGVCP